MPEIKDLIIKHRLNYMEGGTRFPKYDARGAKTRSMFKLKFLICCITRFLDNKDISVRCLNFK